jgi:hypothetical protein
MMRADASQRPETVRSAAMGRSALSLATAFSWGLKSGAIGRKGEEARSGGLDPRGDPSQATAVLDLYRPRDDLEAGTT